MDWTTLKVYVKDQKVIQIEGDPDSPISRGRLCPKGSASEKLVNSPMRETRVKYRRPGATDWEYISLERATAVWRLTLTALLAQAVGAAKASEVSPHAN